MAESRELPGSARKNNERLQSRPYDSAFARFPADEVDEIDTPGGGPYGGISANTNWALVTVAIGVGVAFTAFGFDSPWPLLAGAILIVVGIVWGRMRKPLGGSGTGTVRRTIER